MEKFYLESPSLARKAEAIEYIEEHIKNNADINGDGGMHHILEDTTYEEWLKENKRMKDKEYAYSKNTCPGEPFFLIRENDNKIVGMIKLRHELNEYMKKFGGHIGYGIRPSERGKGYNKINLYLGLLKVKELYDLDYVMLDCDVDNLPSDRSIRALGGEFEREDTDPYDGALVNVYWINVNKSLEKYKNLYGPHIKGGIYEKSIICNRKSK